MEALNTEIFDHDTSIDVAHKINTKELNNWINHLKYIVKELKNLKSICNDDLKNNFDKHDIEECFKRNQIENETLLNALLKYSNSRIDIAECDDNQCDMAYIIEHENYRRSYLCHLDKYRRFKDVFFNVSHGKYSL